MSSLHPNLSVSNATLAGVTLGKFSADLMDACNSAFATDHRPYTRVCALFMFWDNMEDDLPELYECMRTLQDIFQTSYHYTCEDIVLKQNTGENKRRVDVQTTLLRIMHQYEGPETLIILYYGGHSMMLEQPMMQTIVSSQSAEMRGSTQLHTMNLVDVMNATLELHDSDVAYLLDSCYGTSLALKTGKELLASSSVEIVSTASGMTGFTRQLCDLLEKQERKPITLAHIHAKLLKKHFAGIDNTIMGLELTPVHTELNPNQQGSLILAPLRTSSFRNPVPWPSRNVPFLDRDHLKVQISVHMWNTKIPELQNWVKWLTTNKPPFIRELEISVATACRTGSLLVTLIIPAAVHSAMHGNPAYQMIGYVQSNDLWVPTISQPDLPRRFEGLQIRPGGSENIRPGSSSSSGKGSSQLR